MSEVRIELSQRRGFLGTSRRDAWWVQSALTFVILAGFIVYSTWAAFQGVHYAHENYLSPFYSPELFGATSHSWFGAKPGWIPDWLPWSPAFLILWAPAGFRFTCYYYRGAYYKAFWMDPPSCAVGEPRKGYRGENSFPLILQNVHRYFMYLALFFLVFLAYDAWHGFWFDDGAGTKSFGIGVGSFVLLGNVLLLGGYTLSCHSFRHMIGGKKNCLSGTPVRQKAYDCASCLNRKHMWWAWASLFWVAGTDVYVRLCSMGVISDLRII